MNARSKARSGCISAAPPVVALELCKIGMKRAMDRASRNHVRASNASHCVRRRLVLAAFALVTLAMAWLAAGLKVDAGFTKQVPLGHEYMETFLAHRDEFGGADRVVIALVAKDGDMLRRMNAPWPPPAPAWCSPASPWPRGWRRGSSPR